MPSIPQLEYILAVHKAGHFGRAAAEVGVSQPTLSSQIQKAEAELGITIFDRQAKPVVVTQHGAQLIELARSVVAAHEKLMAAASGGFDQLAGPFTLGVIPTLAPYILPWFLSPFAKRYPNIELTVLERGTDDILVEVAASRMDAAILATPLGEPTIAERVLFYDPFYLYAHPDDPLLQHDSIDVEAIESRQLWLLEDGHCFRAQVINLCGFDERAVLPSIDFSARSFETLRNLIDAVGGYTLIPETYARTLPRTSRQQRIRTFSDRVPTRQVSLVHHKRNWKGPILDALSALIAEVMPPSFTAELAQEEVLPIRVQG